MTLSTAAKIAGGATGVAGIPASIYFAHDYATSLYEVENKVIDETVWFTVISTDYAQTIKVATESSKEGTMWSSSNENGYWWQCTVSLPSKVFKMSSILSKIPSSATDQGEEKLKNKEALVQKCSKERPKSSNKTVHASYSIPSNIKENNWEEHLFGKK